MTSPIGSNSRSWKLEAGSRNFGVVPTSYILLPTSCRRGLTLIEVLLSTVILAVGAVFVMQALARISYAHLVAEDQRSASLLAMSKMAEIELAVRAGALSEKGEQGHVRIGLQTFTWDATSAALADDPTRALVHLTISWRRGDAGFERRLDTILRLPLEPSASS